MGLPPDLTWGRGNHRGRGGGGTPSWGEATQHPKKRTHLRWEIRGHPEGGRFHRTTATSFRPQRSGGGGKPAAAFQQLGWKPLSVCLCGGSRWNGRASASPHTPQIFSCRGGAASLWRGRGQSFGTIKRSREDVLSGSREDVWRVFQASSKEPFQVSRSRLVAHQQGRVCFSGPASHPTGWVGGSQQGLGGALLGQGWVFFCVE